MKNVTIIAERLTDRMLAAAIPTAGVVSVSVSSRGLAVRDSVPAGNATAFHNPARFDPHYRIDMIVEDDAVDAVFDCISVAHGAGFFSDAEVWIDSPALALSA